MVKGTYYDVNRIAVKDGHGLDMEDEVYVIPTDKVKVFDYFGLELPAIAEEVLRLKELGHKPKLLVVENPGSNPV